MARAIMIDEFGGPEKLEWREVAVPEPGPGEALIEHKAIGLNFIDTYHRSGLYPLDLPTGLGVEAAGVVTAVGDGVDTVDVGDRVAYLGLPPGAYAEQRVFAANRLVTIPAAVSFETAAAAMLKGLTAWCLLRRSYAVQPGDDILVYAAAGGVGLIAVQWAVSLGARVIGVVSTDAKAALATAAGCAEIVRSDDADFVATVRGMTAGNGVSAVYDSVGKDTFFQSLDCLRPHGTMVTYGNATGAVEPFSPMELAKRGSLFVTRPVVFSFVSERNALVAASAELFGLIETGTIGVQVNQTLPLANAAEAHKALEARRTTGSTVLIP
ncbi:MAG: quinone oxidoreductase [Gammaproteobacteria bacterium]|nr:quinone oxidoreductase [Gammaproteobacteria bacterium]NND37727.1 quinone oxidoreductase [Gammaproteobacteria bacterium]